MLTQVLDQPVGGLWTNYGGPKPLRRPNPPRLTVSGTLWPTAPPGRRIVVAAGQGQRRAGGRLRAVPALHRLARFVSPNLQSPAPARYARPIWPLLKTPTASRPTTSMAGGRAEPKALL